MDLWSAMDKITKEQAVDLAKMLVIAQDFWMHV